MLIIGLSIGLVVTTIKLIDAKRTNTVTPSQIKNDTIVVEKPNDRLELDNTPINEENIQGNQTSPNNNEDKNPVNPVNNKDNSKIDVTEVPPIEVKVQENTDTEVKGVSQETVSEEDKTKNDNNNKNKDKNEKSILNNKVITEEKAIEIGLKKVGSGGKLEKIESDLEDNPPIYKLKIIKNKHKYEIEIHARTGAILEHEKKKIKD